MKICVEYRLFKTGQTLGHFLRLLWSYNKFSEGFYTNSSDEISLSVPPWTILYRRLNHVDHTVDYEMKWSVDGPLWLRRCVSQQTTGMRLIILKLSLRESPYKWIVTFLIFINSEFQKKEEREDFFPYILQNIISTYFRHLSLFWNL